jgi:hypothetical protein
MHKKKSNRKGDIQTFGGLPITTVSCKASNDNNNLVISALKGLGVHILFSIVISQAKNFKFYVGKM